MQIGWRSPKSDDALYVHYDRRFGRMYRNYGMPGMPLVPIGTADGSSAKARSSFIALLLWGIGLITTVGCTGREDPAWHNAEHLYDRIGIGRQSVSLPGMLWVSGGSVGSLETEKDGAWKRYVGVVGLSDNAEMFVAKAVYREFGNVFTIPQVARAGVERDLGPAPSMRGARKIRRTYRMETCVPPGFFQEGGPGSPGNWGLLMFCADGPAGHYFDEILPEKPQKFSVTVGSIGKAYARYRKDTDSALRKRYDTSLRNGVRGIGKVFADDCPAALSDSGTILEYLTLVKCLLDRSPVGISGPGNDPYRLDLGSPPLQDLFFEAILNHREELSGLTSAGCERIVRLNDGALVSIKNGGQRRIVLNIEWEGVAVEYSN